MFEDDIDDRDREFERIAETGKGAEALQQQAAQDQIGAKGLGDAEFFKCLRHWGGEAASAWGSIAGSSGSAPGAARSKAAETA